MANDHKKANLLLNSVATKRESLYIGFVAEDPTAGKNLVPKMPPALFLKNKSALSLLYTSSRP
ncbi:hypothetical protein, partial [Sphingobacterium daejeonense]|uniref:hypothetical protein n=1 Tax=Sphingobacterium daejeonense TaxID=371142 RepID=UPI003D31550B